MIFKKIQAVAGFSYLSCTNSYGRVDRTEIKTPSTLPTRLPLLMYNLCLSRFKKCFQMVPNQ